MQGGFIMLKFFEKIHLNKYYSSEKNENIKNILFIMCVFVISSLLSTLSISLPKKLFKPLIILSLIYFAFRYLLAKYFKYHTEDCNIKAFYTDIERKYIIYFLIWIICFSFLSIKGFL